MFDVKELIYFGYEIERRRLGEGLSSIIVLIGPIVILLARAFLKIDFPLLVASSPLIMSSKRLSFVGKMIISLW